ncbi:type I glyceraldehyde-3-phosphate dehydrogenase [Desulfoferrobacter suflitae]|uniref:type I glyceraldehyde-3-phosphate dehydrogenase n=1 Tax=Desulfoferrobacter suflitae TaxID=2865782 RepID=UPI0021641286|nr:glyceraldehyde 3-phosphate dehydrogenase NAD-binding domain-containing protein [Desulfoferrobacter suflitae]MCK8600160.1 glyceraldehyde-3-phosphate dehydrogenase [Desulfoferrobacter suflitae]
MDKQEKFVPMKLGLNGLGRIAKLSIWHHAERQYFSELVVNIGREVGSSLQDIAHFLERDSTYGNLSAFLYGCRAQRVIEDLNEDEGSMRINGVKARFLRQHRNPADIGWRNLGVELVVDATGAFLDPTLAPDNPKGSVRGHLAAGAKKIIVSAPFKIKDKGRDMPSDAITTIMGINDADYDPKKHVIVSAASCTTTCLAYMMKPLLDCFGAERILSASMTTVHASTSSQPVLDRAPKAKATDLRKNRSVMNNIILTTTGAAKALSLVIPEMKTIGFIAESVRVPVTTGSLIILVVMFQDESLRDPISREKINDIYKSAAEQYPDGYLVYSEGQNVSSDIIGLPRAAAVIEGHENHTRTAAVRFDTERILKACIAEGGERLDIPTQSKVVQIPVTQAVIYGWYDNELGSYTNMLGDRTVSLARLLQH